VKSGTLSDSLENPEISLAGVDKRYEYVLGWIFHCSAEAGSEILKHTLNEWFRWGSPAMAICHGQVSQNLNSKAICLEFRNHKKARKGCSRPSWVEFLHLRNDPWLRFGDLFDSQHFLPLTSSRLINLSNQYDTPFVVGGSTTFVCQLPLSRHIAPVPCAVQGEECGEVCTGNVQKKSPAFPQSRAAELSSRRCSTIRDQLFRRDQSRP
jgi:hypothetical protein